MNTESKTYLYLTLEQLIWATVPVTEDLDEAIIVAVDELARHKGTALWIEDADAGGPRRYDDPRSARCALQNTRTVVDVFLRPSHNPTDDHSVLMSARGATRFSLIVANAEEEYAEAVEGLREAVADSEPRDSEATHDIQAAVDEVVKAAERASRAHPPIEIDSRSEIDALLKESAWRMTEGRIISRVSGIVIGAMTRVSEWEQRSAVRFKFRLEDEVSWRDAYAFVCKEDGRWRITDHEATWLQKRKRQYRINDAQIGVIHQLLDEMGIREDQPEECEA